MGRQTAQNRSTVPFESLPDLASSISEVASILDSVGRSTFALLVDLRDGPMRNDPAFEVAMAEQRARLLAGIARVAVIVRTPLGTLQLNRHQRQGKLEWTTFNDEAAALAFLGIAAAAATSR